MRRVLLPVLALVLVTSCTGGSEDAAPAPAPPAAPATAAPALQTEPEDVAQVSAEVYAPGPGKTVTELEDVVVEEVVVEEVRSPDAVVDGRTVPGVVVPGFTLPAQVADAGCTIEYDAPAGCLPAVEISASRLPGVVVPARTLPEQRLPDGRVLPALVQEGWVQETEVEPGGRSEQRCQVEREGARVVGPVVRSPVIRRNLLRGVFLEPQVLRPATCGAQGCVPAVLLPATSLPPVAVPAAVVQAAVLQARVLDRAPDVEVLDGEGSTAYVTPGDVLFDTGSAALRRGALPSVDAVAAQVLRLDRGAAVTVDGHTDDVGSDADNQALSERRAAAVADRLVGEGVPRDRLTVRGFGEDEPAADGTGAQARQLNRRVVVGVADS